MEFGAGGGVFIAGIATASSSLRWQYPVSVQALLLVSYTAMKKTSLICR